MSDVLNLPIQLVEILPHVWTFLLLAVRYAALMMLLPGISGGAQGMTIRAPAIIVFAFVSLISGQISPLPENVITMLANVASEYLFGFMLGFVPALITAGVQTAAQLSTGTMGLGAAQLMDPNLGVSVSSLGRVLTDLVICLFLALGGHHVMIYAASGLGGVLVPGTFLVEEQSLQLVIHQTGRVFEIGVLLSAPVIVALLLTQFVMGLISKAVPTVNIFIVSFPLTIGIGLVLSVLSLPEIFTFAEREFNLMEQRIGVFVQSVEEKDPVRVSK